LQQLEGSIISRYRIQKQIASGGLLKSYRAIDRRTGQLVVMKLIHYSNNENIERLQRTIQVLSELKHEHILPILDHGQHELWYYLVTPSSEDETLEQQFSKDPLSLEDAGHILEQLADALQFAHRRGIIYRNVQPGNILILLKDGHDGHHIYLTDASLSHDLQDEQSPVETADAAATASNVLPEQLDEQATLTDSTYALGILLYQMLTGGCTPSQLLSFVDMQGQQAADLPLSPSKLDLSVPGAIKETIVRALAPDPQARFQTPLEFAQAYQSALAQFISPTAPVTVFNKLKNLSVPLVRILPPQKVSLIQKLTRKYRGERLLVAVIASAVILILTSLFIAGVSFFGTHQQVAQQNHQSGQASQPSRTSGTISSSPTISPTANNKLPSKKHHLKRVRPNNGPIYGTQPTVQPVMQPYPTYQPTVQASPTVQITVQPYPAVQPTVQASPTVQPTVQPPTPTPTPSATKQPGNHGNEKGRNAASAPNNAS
jgi:serine/threonine protein kinase